MGRLEKEESTRLERIYKIHNIKDKEKRYEQLELLQQVVPFRVHTFKGV